MIVPFVLSKLTGGHRLSPPFATILLRHCDLARTALRPVGGGWWRAAAQRNLVSSISEIFYSPLCPRLFVCAERLFALSIQWLSPLHRHHLNPLLTAAAAAVPVDHVFARAMTAQLCSDRS